MLLYNIYIYIYIFFLEIIYQSSTVIRLTNLITYARCQATLV